MLKYCILFILLASCTISQPKYSSGSVAADHELASLAGVEILQQGGNAVDAAVATSFALSVVRPFSCGIGGGGFMLIDSPSMDPVALNYRETSPQKVWPNFFKTNNSRFGGTAVGIPGTVAGLLLAHERFGVLSRTNVLAPAIRLASEGFKLDVAFKNAYASALQSIEHQTDTQQEQAKRALDSITELSMGGSTQSEVLRLIANYGTEGFYKGKVAESIVQATTGHLTLEDLRSYSPRWEQPLQIEIGDGSTIISMPPPSSGGVAIGQIIGILQRCNAYSLAPSSQEYSHVLVESMKHAFADRAEHMADAAFIDVPVESLLEHKYLDDLASRISSDTTQGTFSYGSSLPPPDDDGTSHLCVVDKNGMMVSATETINTSFGSLLLVEPFGFMLNNEMDDFSSPSGANVYGLRQSDKNLPEPGKRPLSSMSPTIVERDGTPILALGASGGPRIISSVVQVLLHILWYGDEPIEALNRTRLHHQWLPNRVYFEERTKDISIETYLNAIGHETTERANIGVVQVIELEEGKLKPASDPRKGGKSAGY